VVRVAVEQQAFGTLLRSLRETSGLSQEELAERAGLSSHAVSALERGARTRPYPHTIRSLADALAVDDTDRAALIAAVPARRRTTSGPGDAAAPPRSKELPEPATALLGRDPETSRVSELLRTSRLVTLTGTGGVGKTRLALAVAKEVRARFADGACLVELAPLLDPEAVLPAVADAIDAGPAVDGDHASAIADRLRDRQLLLVLDNFEHVLDAAPDVAVVIGSAPGLTVLTTSRAPLRVRGEAEFVVEPLGLPEVHAETTEPAASVRLLLERARAVSPGWGHSEADRTAVEAICVRLAGVPLALELAAARARLLDPASLLDRLDDAVEAGPRDLPERQRTMRATLDWSYGLLSPDEQALLRLLSVFVGGFRLDDLESVAASIDGWTADPLALLASLSEHSLVTADPGTGSFRRFRLLEPVSQYARDRLLEQGEEKASYAAHLDHYLRLAEQAAPHYQDGEQVVWLARIDAEHPNLTAAAERGLAAGEHTLVARLSWALWMYWWLRGHHAHGRRLAEAALAHDLPDDVRPRAELAAATMSFAMDDIPASRDWWERARDHSLEGGDVLAQANSVAGVGLADLAVGDLAAARASFDQAAPLARDAGQPGEWTAGLNHVWTGTVALLSGDPDAAADHIGRGLESANRRRDRLTMYVARYNLSQVELARGDHAEARHHLDEGMRLSLKTGDHANLAYFLDAMAVLEAAEGTHARVPLLLGAAQGIREVVGARGYGFYRPDPAAAAAAESEARSHLGADRFDDALDVGRGLRPEEAVALALGERAPVG
jgi:predicted ATPase/DNA-binding XRE family transcriptional regulator